MDLLFILYDHFPGFGTYTTSILNRQALKTTRRICHNYFENNEFFRTSERPYPKHYNFENSFNVKNDYKRYKVLWGTTRVWKMQHIQQEFVLHALKSDDEMRKEHS